MGCEHGGGPAQEVYLGVSVCVSRKGSRPRGGRSGRRCAADDGDSGAQEARSASDGYAGGVERVGVEGVFPALALGASWREALRRVCSRSPERERWEDGWRPWGGVERVGVEGVFPALALGASWREGTPPPDREEPGEARAEAGESLRLKMMPSRPSGHPVAKSPSAEHATSGEPIRHQLEATRIPRARAWGFLTGGAAFAQRDGVARTARIRSRVTGSITPCSVMMPLM